MQLTSWSDETPYNRLKDTVGDRDKVVFMELSKTVSLAKPPQTVGVHNKHEQNTYLRAQIDLFTFLFLPVFSLTSYYFGRIHRTFTMLTLATIELFDFSLHP